MSDLDTNPGQVFQATQAQQLIWAGQRLQPEIPLYNMAIAYWIEGEVDVSAFARAFDHLVEATDAMRIRFTESEGVAAAAITTGLGARLEVVDVSANSDPDASARDLINDATHRPFKIDGCLYRSYLIRTGDADVVWVLVQHHLITDGWSKAITFRRMSDLYAEEVANEPVEREYPRYTFYADYEHASLDTEERKRSEAHWQERSAATLPDLSFYGADTASRTASTTRTVVNIGVERTNALRGRATSIGGLLTADLGLFNLLATTLFATVRRATGECDLAVLAPAHNRGSHQFRETAGLFIEVLPVHVSLDDGETFESLYGKVSEESRLFLTHSRPGTSVLSNNRSHSVLLNYINTSFGDFHGMPVRSEWVHSGYGDSAHALRLQVHDYDDSGSLSLLFDLRDDIFDSQRTGLIVGHFTRILDALLADPAQTIDEVDLLNRSEIEALEAFGGVDVDVGFGSIVEWFEDSPAGEVAVMDQAGRNLGRDQLRGLSGGLTERIIGLVGSGSRVGLFMERSIGLVVSVWGVLRSSSAYVPIDPSLPTDRVNFLIEDAEIVLVLTTEDLTDRLPPGNYQTLIVNVDEMESTGATVPTPTGSDLAYIMYTSGSTGTPKGVGVSHGALVNYLWSARDTYATEGPVSMPFYSSFSFDLTVTSLFLPTLTGGKIVVYPPTSATVDLSILDVFEDQTVDTVKLTPSHLALLQEHHFTPDKTIRTLIVGGEDLTTALARQVHDWAEGNIRIFNEYGPTEATVGAMHHLYNPTIDTEPSVPLGHPAANTRIYLYDHHHNPTRIIKQDQSRTLLGRRDNVVLSHRSRRVFDQRMEEGFDLADEPFRLFGLVCVGVELDTDSQFVS